MITNIDKEKYDSYRFSENIHFLFRYSCGKQKNLWNIAEKEVVVEVHYLFFSSSVAFLHLLVSFHLCRSVEQEVEAHCKDGHSPLLGPLGMSEQ